MYDCHDDVLAFHNEKVTLSQPQRTEMRDRRNANRKRLKDRLKEKKLPRVEEWFYDTNEAKSPDTENGRQFRRTVRDVKKFARSRAARKDEIASGFTITKLIEECFVADEHREDVALRETMRRMYDRLNLSLEVSHPTTAGERLTTADDPRAAFLRDKLSIALEDLKVLDDPACTAKQARKAWDKVFNTDFFSGREVKEAAAASGVTVLSNLLSKRDNPRPVDKQGGGRFA